MSRRSKYFAPTVDRKRAIQYRAERDGIELNLLEEDIVGLIQQACHYCGCAPVWPAVVGIDRKDNNQGYVYGNCLPCCSQCNYMKGTLNYATFLRKCSEIAAFHPRNNKEWTTSPT